MNQLKGEAMQVWGGLRAGIGAVLLAFMVGCGSEETQSIEPVVVNKSPNDNVITRQ